ncbi:hypothetical protein NG895_29125 [Aeoliella sp. ICT_H6.2]|uniref:Uncharacterized protein n=1 Tax=Aeoliella straminimaris TaxID=2954799 RepID=A0A9X2JL36_9BACT|nr:hypothetical protein [Aeoliella straminimaris]MCO6047984.1 hypothetical protein [Aeoliella straminimaris]
MSGLRVCCIALLVCGVNAAPAAFSREPTIAERYQAVGDKVRHVIKEMKGVTQNRTERDDMRALEHLLREYDRAVHAHDWKKAYSIGKNMRVYMSRAKVVAGESTMRKEARARADAERRHQEEMAQRERHHEEQMFMEGRHNDHVKIYLWRKYGIAP